jgi:hypothetical protein
MLTILIVPSFLNYKGFTDSMLLFSVFFSDAIVAQLYSDFGKIFFMNFIVDTYSGTFVSSLFTQIS